MTARREEILSTIDEGSLRQSGNEASSSSHVQPIQTSFVKPTNLKLCVGCQVGFGMVIYSRYFDILLIDKSIADSP